MGCNFILSREHLFGDALVSPHTLPRLLLLTFALLLGLPVVAHAQKGGFGKRERLPVVAPAPATHAPAAFGPLDVGHETEWLAESRRLAEDTFEATQADPKGLAREKVAVAKGGFNLALDAYRYGRMHIWHAGFSEWSERMLKAEQAAGARAEALLAALERRWLWAILGEQQVAEDSRTGRVGREQA